MQRKKTLAYETKVPGASADKPDSVAPASGIRLVRPPLATLPGASSVPPPPSAMPSTRSAPPPPAVRAVTRTLPLAIAPVPAPAAKAAPSSAEKLEATPLPSSPKARFGSPKALFGKTMVPPPPPSGPRARGLSSAPPPSKRPPRPEPQLIDDDSIVEDDAPTVAETDDLVEVEATLVSPPSAPPRSSRPPSSSAPRKLPSLRATGQNWPRVEWPRLDLVDRGASSSGATPKPAGVRPHAPPRPASSPPPPPAEVMAQVTEIEIAALEAAANAIDPIQPIPADPTDIAEPSDIAGTAFDLATPDSVAPSVSDVEADVDTTVAPPALEAAAPRTDDVYVEPAASGAASMLMLPPPPSAVDLALEAAPTSMVFVDEDPIDFRPVSPLVHLRAAFDPARFRAALAQVRPIIAWLDRNPRAFASVGFGAGVVVALFVALLVQ